MTFAKGILAALALAAAVGQASATELEHWPAPAARQLNALIEANANKGAYAVFDMDNTSYRYDLEESLLPYLEMKGVLTRDRLDPSLKRGCAEFCVTGVRVTAAAGGLRS